MARAYPVKEVRFLNPLRCHTVIKTTRSGLIKRLIEWTAADGISLSDFALGSVKHRAQGVLVRQQRIQLFADVSRQFTHILTDSTTALSDGLRDAMLRHDALIESESCFCGSV